ncbi:hypothetical protein GCM10008942_02770 [Rhizomicrobium electricum]|uniref:Uncharacterized protein n=1 Tax=Rhizomicrobium electricum TaxID=480070 RepID=A0ABP3P3C6_9PROT
MTAGDSGPAPTNPKRPDSKARNPVLIRKAPNPRVNGPRDLSRKAPALTARKRPKAGSGSMGCMP